MIVAADHDSAADTRAQREHHQAMRIPAGADPVFTIRGSVSVVLEHDRLAQAVGEQLADRQVIPPGQVRRLEQHAGVEVHRAG